jgi:hypothetical protein
LTVYPDTLGPYAVSANANDGEISASPTWYQNGEPGYHIYMGEDNGGKNVYGYFRFQLAAAITTGSDITSATLEVVASDTWQWDADDALKIWAEDSSNAAEVTTAQNHPNLGSSPRTLTTATQRWPVSGGLSWPSAGTGITSPSFDNCIQELVDSYSGLAQNAYIQIWIAKNTLQSTSEEVACADYSHTTYDPAELTIVYTAAAIEQEGFRFRNDDGTEATATWKANQDTNINLAADTAVRIRMLLNATGDPASIGAQLEYRYKPSGGAFGSWTKVN